MAADESDDGFLVVVVIVVVDDKGGSFPDFLSLASLAALCSASKASNCLLLPWTLRRAERLCDLQVSECVQGVNLLPSSDTPQCRSGS